ncbi:glycosyltransferase family 9 protein [Cerasicoccus maritimus]|uniref:glycosyltransferase family 9 protein n=1 Tax=Cerasicoccus maritimus TaxID=490089 RepID=UPI0028525689|nr:glycosyltransferase family 9 protein [Cerasicoccus maritimus]
MRREKILAIKFKFLGDVAIMVPALRMLRQHLPEAEIHVLVAAEAATVLERLDWIDKVWSLKRHRGKLRLRDSLPLIRQLRAENFDRSVDFVGNDRGAVLSRMIGARERLGVLAPKGFKGRTKCYTQSLEQLDTTRHECVRDAYVLSGWGVPFDREALRLELVPNPDFAAEAAKILPEPCLICHLSTSQPKKEWPIGNWVELYGLMTQAGHKVVFTAGHTDREQALLTELKAALPEANCLPVFSSLELFIATMARATMLISPDTAPLHLAAGLCVPTVGFFGPTASSCWAPIGPKNRSIQGEACPCSGHLHVCKESVPCINTVTPARVAAEAKSLAAAIAR